ncbi:hypothetical protein PI124_g13078 [Phytophthora idaei]|nr:hypothetical protein PI125_g18267 [Phytophthora idaei]KAG3129814.1 hypothetical protein PI126_g20781 [Phytophthora idaei]KAG3242061.1 hypothetical protein PI124_g13078 [Phytophthora idaei]
MHKTWTNDKVQDRQGRNVSTRSSPDTELQRLRVLEATKQFTSLAATPSVARATYWAHRASPLIIPATASSEMKQVGRWRGPISHLLLKRTTWKTR